jgi:hypothetical protein
LLSGYTFGGGSGTILESRLELINYVKAKIDEIIPEGEGVQFNVETEPNISDPYNLLINSLLDEAAKKTLMTAPIHVIEPTDASTQEVTPDDGVKATVTVDMTNANADLTYKAKVCGTGGNSITVTHVDPLGNEQPLTVTVVGTDITVSLETDETGTIISTANEVKAAIDADTDASLLVSVSVEGTGAGVVEAKAEATLSGGTAATEKTGYVELPANFLRLISFKMTDWNREVNEAITTYHPLYKLQRNPYVRGGVDKPVAVYNWKVISGASTRTIEYYSITSDHTVEKFLYVPETVAEEVQSNLTDALTWFCAAMILQITEMYDASKIAEEQGFLTYRNM